MVTMKNKKKIPASETKSQTPRMKTTKSKPGYLEKNPDIQVTSVDKTGRLSTKNLIMRNGNLTGYVFVADLGMATVKNTCSFDAVAQVITSAYIDHQHFRDIVNNRKTKTLALDLIAVFAAKGDCKDVYKKRAELLIPLSSLEGAKQACTSARTKTRNSMSIYSYTLAKLNEIDDNVPNGNVSALWEVLLSNFPSIVIQYICPSKHEVSEVLVQPDLERLASHGIKDLQKSVTNCLESKTTGSCQRCSTKCNGKSECQNILILNLEEMKLSNKSKSSITLEEIPKSLVVGDRRLTLVGLVQWTGNHFTAFTKRRTGEWQKVDDCNSKIYTRKLGETVVPHVLIYVPV